MTDRAIVASAQPDCRHRRDPRPRHRPARFVEPQGPGAAAADLNPTTPSRAGTSRCGLPPFCERQLD